MDAIKIDVEGHEEAVLKGADQLIDRERPSMIIEIEERHHPDRSEAIIGSILEKDYAAYAIVRDRLQRFHSGQIQILQPAGLNTEYGKAKSEDYVNNFVFLPN